jgi:uncharacterized metal-binding protein
VFYYTIFAEKKRSVSISKQGIFLAYSIERLKRLTNKLEVRFFSIYSGCCRPLGLQRSHIVAAFDVQSNSLT